MPAHHHPRAVAGLVPRVPSVRIADLQKMDISESWSPPGSRVPAAAFPARSQARVEGPRLGWSTGLLRNLAERSDR